MKANIDFSFVNNCGVYDRTIFKINDIYYLGCFESTYDEAREAISEDYEDNELLNDYLEKLDLLRDGGQPMEEYDWERYSWALVGPLPDLIRQNPEKFNWEEASYLMPEVCPDLIREYPEKFNWESESWAVAKFCPELIKEFPEKFNWKDNLIYIEEFCPEYLQYNKGEANSL